MEKEGHSRFFDKEDFKKYSFWIIIAILLILSFLILKQYLIALISAFILAYLIRPVYKKLEKKIGKFLAAFLSVWLVVIIIVVPMGFVFGSVAREAAIYLTSGGFEDFVNVVFSHPFFAKLDLNFDALTGVGSPVVAFLTSLFSALPSFLISLLIILFGAYYMLLSWDKLALGLRKLLPIRNKDIIIEEIAKITNIMVYGTLFIALIEFVISAIVFYIFGVKFYLLLATLIFILAFIPGGGPALVWLPTAIYFMFNYNYSSGIGILALGLILSIGIDFLFRAKILGHKSRINPLIMILGIFGGISVFGLFGFIIGPLILAYVLEIIEAFAKET